MNVKKLIDILEKRGFFYQTAEIYGGISGFFDLGPLGVLLKNNIIKIFKEVFVDEFPYKIYEIEASLFAPSNVLKASGHLERFYDPIIECEKCKSIFRADHLIEEELNMNVEGISLEKMDEIIKKNNLKCKCGGNFSQTKEFKLLFKSFVGAKNDEIYLRPETAQHIFVNFLNVYNSMRAKLPFGILQIGKSFRNEISPRQFLIRLREFSQAEIEFFFNPNYEFSEIDFVLKEKIPIYKREEQRKNSNIVEKISIEELIEEKIIPNKLFGLFLLKEIEFYRIIGIEEDKIRFRHLLEEETPFYSKSNVDLEIKFDFGWKEVVGNAYRTDYDLKQHSKYSNKEIFVVENGKKFVPHVIEPSFGIERTIYAVLQNSFIENGRGWSYFLFKPKIAPIKVAIFPLVNKDGLAEIAEKIFKDLKKEFECIIEFKDSIGKRYARADEIGIPFCITCDYQTLEDSTVTIRDIATAKQKRLAINELKESLKKLI
ncbi:MAG: glycine--tRNA ligase [Candidatus Aenigmarchaeota archaeon]|nr:glycine--tRNA ligase [Candidatus Aenigmarchaeota archaeon]MDW8149518.1 glycine--tRNA ligase [Candidatus Aenigmarchaeota archaeon]